LADGSYTVILTVTDDDGATDQTSQPVNLDIPPVASFTYDCTDLTCSFDASGSSDPGGGSLTYAWDFGDGNSGTGVAPSHPYLADGDYTVILTVTDDEAATDQIDQIVLVNAPPEASFTYDCHGLSCDFNASGSSDPGGGSLTYAWDFGDGNSGAGVAPSHSYAADGSYTVILAVTDDEAATDQASQVVTVQGGGAQTVHVGDLDGTKTSVRNTWTAAVTIEVHDGSHTPVSGATVHGDWSEGAGDSTECATDDSGRCTVEKTGIPKKVSSVVFTVTDVNLDGTTYADAENHDPDGDSNGTRITVPPPANQAPVASFSYVCTDRTCDFDASASYDLDGSIVSYDWVFGDGNIASGIATSHTYADEGTYAVDLTVTDDLGATGTDSQSVTVGSGGGDTMHVGSLTGDGTPGKRNRWDATVAIAIHDQAHASLPNATVTGSWSNGATGSAECTTDGSGQCTVAKANLKTSVGSVTFTVMALTHPTHSYSPAENHNPSGNQPNITVSAP
jgi:PKD repeat protein